MCSLCDIENGPPDPQDEAKAEPQLRDLAKNLRDKGFTTNYGPLANVPQLATLIVLVAKDVASVNYTGRTYEMIEADARLVLGAVMEGATAI